MRLDRDIKAPTHNEHVQSDQGQNAEQPEFFAHNGEDEVGIPFRQELELRLRAVRPALAEQATRTDRDL